VNRQQALGIRQQFDYAHLRQAIVDRQQKIDFQMTDTIFTVESAITIHLFLLEPSNP
jgi:hypothetical protein